MVEMVVVMIAVHNLEENCQCQSPDEGVQAHPELLSGVRASRDLESWGAVLGSPQGQNELMVVV